MQSSCILSVAVYTFFIFSFMYMTPVSAASSSVCQPSTCGAASCCPDATTGHAVCYDASQYNCIDSHLCPKGTGLCGASCYDQSVYTCSKGKLVQAQATPTVTPTPKKASPTSAPTSQPTSAPTSPPTVPPTKAATQSPTSASTQKPATATATPASATPKPVITTDYFASTTLTSGGVDQHITYYYAFSALKWRIDYETSISYIQRSDLSMYYQILPSQEPQTCYKMTNAASLVSPWSWLAQATEAGTCSSGGVSGSLWTYSFVSNLHPAKYTLCVADNKPLVYTFDEWAAGTHSVGTQVYNTFVAGAQDSSFFEVPDYCN